MGVDVGAGVVEDVSADLGSGLGCRGSRSCQPRPLLLLYLLRWLLWVLPNLLMGWGWTGPDYAGLGGFLLGFWRPGILMLLSPLSGGFERNVIVYTLPRGPRFVSLEYTIRSAIAPTLSAN